jgi:hypothetical protein
MIHIATPHEMLGWSKFHFNSSKTFGEARYLLLMHTMVTII